MISVIVKLGSLKCITNVFANYLHLIPMSVVILLCKQNQVLNQCCYFIARHYKGLYVRQESVGTDRILLQGSRYKGEYEINSFGRTLRYCS